MAFKRVWALVVLTLISIFSFFWFWPDERLHFIACDVGQGDAILITQGFNQVLIDGGPSDKVLGCLARQMPFWDRQVELVVNTHPEYDHLKGLVAVVKSYRVEQLLSNSLFSETDLFAEFQDLVRKEKIKVYSPRQGEIIKVGELAFKVLWPNERLGDLALWQTPITEVKDKVLGAMADQRKLNETSIVLLLEKEKFKALLTGDIPQKVEEALVDYCQLQDCGQPVSVLKVGHHGSKTSTSQAFLDFFQPLLAVISVGENKWGHPTDEVLLRLKEKGVKILRTDELGDIKLTTDGQKIYYP